MAYSFPAGDSAPNGLFGSLYSPFCVSVGPNGLRLNFDLQGDVPENLDARIKELTAIPDPEAEEISQAREADRVLSEVRKLLRERAEELRAGQAKLDNISLPEISELAALSQKLDQWARELETARKVEQRARQAAEAARKKAKPVIEKHYREQWQDKLSSLVEARNTLAADLLKKGAADKLLDELAAHVLAIDRLAAPPPFPRALTQAYLGEKFPAGLLQPIKLPAFEQPEPVA